ncbi:hemoglobin/transferrin/lactoferrin receptor protein [Ruegeria halocynthiae]|uniref:Hemoglobin/transferrin/lactoferrin receptor protein n=1 Tax=Ruegeria halocynthiae TaxID=985054 RepID=A0A1H2XW23_9RHOB|nr:TonB-dependent receptor [Ruegeria halocynthiae]SDW97066.1 hemoglobin/transferrin/lactoferrin receptor protein [Ruegeria halocynthiae]
MKSTLKLSTAAAALLGSVITASPLVAQEADDEVIVLDDIIVTGTGIPTEVFKSPGSVTVVDSDEISEIPPTSVANLLSDVPGIQVSENDLDRIRIRGEDSQRVAILLDGQRLSDHNRYGTPLLISPTEIERIEIVRGPSSVVSGNRAIGGVVNIITKRGADKPLEVSGTVGYIGANNGYRAAVSAAGTIDNFDYRLSYSESDLGDRSTPDGDLVPSGSDDRGLLGYLGYDFGQSYVGFRAQDYDASTEVFTGDPDTRINLPKRDLRKYSAFYEGEDLTPWMSMLRFSIYQQKVERRFESSFDLVPVAPFDPDNVTATSDDEQTTKGFLATANFEFAPGHRSVLGLEYEDDRLETNKSTGINITPPFGPPIEVTIPSFTDAETKTTSVFGQHEMTFGALTATLGARYYSVKSQINKREVNGANIPNESNKDDRWLGSAGLVYNLSNGTILRANISQGYTYPSLAELYIDTQVNGQRVTGNSDLQPETATNYEIGGRIDRGNLTLDAAIFYTRSKDYIAIVPDPVTPTQSTYGNIDRVKSWGFEIAAEFDPGWGGVRPYAVLSNVTREFDYGNGKKTKNSGTPEWTGTIGLRSNWQAANFGGTWDVFLRGESSSSLEDENGDIVDSGTPTGLNPTSGWTTLNFRGSVDLNENARLTLELDNILDKSYRASDQIPASGRSVSLFVTTTF